MSAPVHALGGGGDGGGGGEGGGTADTAEAAPPPPPPQATQNKAKPKIHRILIVARIIRRSFTDRRILNCS
ncbi:protein of unknown function [uncultured Woeseiaceae bacterium]|uniref:Uncharacterized protein n=1 Tax=uncultured Woeseiaceae bacterium TaxID=1983305 RepID=A0A7D9D266_9GAMM|nr:protein of unknown function [uncultured Woeseiaceae bacterium]